MRHPRYGDEFNDRKNFRYLLIRLLVVYFSLGMLLVGVAHVKDKFSDHQAEAAQQEAAIR